MTSCWHCKIKVSCQCIQGPKTHKSSLQSPGRYSIVSWSSSRSKKAHWGLLPRLLLYVAETILQLCIWVCVCVRMYVCEHLRTFTWTYMWHFLSKALLKSCRGICGFHLPSIPHFGEFPWDTLLLVLISNGRWGRGSSNRRDSTEQNFISELWHERERIKACRISFLHFAFSYNYLCKSIFKHQMGKILQLFWFHTLTVFTC